MTTEGNGNPLQYSWLGNSIDRGAWPATVHGVAKSCQKKFYCCKSRREASVLEQRGREEVEGAREVCGLHVGGRAILRAERAEIQKHLKQEAFEFAES